MDQYFEGDELNRTIRSYIINVSNLIPDSTTLGNIWSLPLTTYSDQRTDWFGIGLNGSATMLSQSQINSVIEGAEGFGGKNNMDLSQFPEGIPFLPGISIDIRYGKNYFDIGLAGMWLNESIVMEQVGTTFLGDGSNYSFRSLGMDFRYSLSQHIFNSYRVKPFDLSLQTGYYFTWLGFGIKSHDTESVSVDFRNDSVFFSAQLSKTLIGFLTPYVGGKVIFSKTNSGFTWETDRPVMFRDDPYPDGLKYKSGNINGDYYTYFQVYGGFGLNFLFPHIVTLGGAYNVVTEHFGVNLSMRIIVPYISEFL